MARREEREGRVRFFICWYWLVGCALVGAAWSGYMKDCPNSHIRRGELIELVAIWPVSVVAAITDRPPLHQTVCHD